MTPEQIRKERMKLYTEMRSILDACKRDASTGEPRGLTDAEKTRLDTIETKLAEFEGLLDLAEREANLAKAFKDIDDATFTRMDDVLPGGAGDDPEKRYNEMFTTYLRHGAEALDGAQKRSLQLGRASLDEDTVKKLRDAGVGNALIAKLRDQNIGIGAAGGFTVPQGFWAKITERVKLYSGMLQVSNILPTADGITIPWPSNDDTGNMGSILGENTVTTPLDLAFGVRQLGAFMFTSNMIKTSLQLLQDSGVDVEAFIAKKIGQRIGRRLNLALTTGSGAGEPQGLVTGAVGNGQSVVVGNGLGGTTSFAKPTSGTYDGYQQLVDLVHAVDAAYRSAGNVGFMAHDLTIAQLMKLEDAQGRPLWLPLTSGIGATGTNAPGTLIGYPYTVNNHMPISTAAAPAPGAVTALFGNFEDAYVARNVAGGSVLRLSERYADFLEVAFLGFERHDGLVDDQFAVSYYQTAAS